MSILASLERAYQRRLTTHGDVPPFGYSRVEVGFCVVLRADGNPAFKPIDLRTLVGKKLVGPRKNLPTPLNQRTSNISSNFLWDKTAYALGVTAGKVTRTREEHAKFADLHLSALMAADDTGLLALRRFIERWQSALFMDLSWPQEMLDQNIVFALEDSYRLEFIHERDASKELWSRLLVAEKATEAPCLVFGETNRIARSHPPIKGVKDAQSSGAFIVSFNDDAYTSYGHEQGDNAPVSEAAAFAYTTALNRFLEKDSGHRIQIGDASVVFWADSEEADKALLADAYFHGMFFDDDDQTPLKIDENTQAERVGAKLDLIRKGVPLEEVEPKLATNVRFHVLGLAPNAARLSIRFYFEDTFSVLAENYRDYANDVRLGTRVGPSRPITVGRLAIRTAPARRDRNDKLTFDKDRVSDLLCGELTRAILTGGNFPASLLSLLLMRVRGDHHLDHVRVALIKALLVRRMRRDSRLPKHPNGQFQEDYLVRTDPNDPNEARRLGRLFAVFERAQLAALGDGINATVKDKFLGAAAATPARVFPGILKNAQNHLKRLRNGHSDAAWIKDAQHARRVGAALDRDIGRLWASFENGISEQHSNEEQGLFFIGYYQERFGGKPDSESGAVDTEPTIEQEKE